MEGAGALTALGIGSAAGAQEPKGGNAGANEQARIDAQTWPGETWNAPLKGKVAVITGAARGIGRSIAVAMAANGADIVAIDINTAVSPIVQYIAATPADLEETGKLVRQHGRKFLGITADIRDINSLRAAAEKAVQQMGQINIVVANAAIQAFTPLVEMEDHDWHDVIDNNLNGSANTLRAFAPVLIKQGKGGRIIFMSSMQGRYGTKNGAAYSASKWGIVGLMKSAALELGKYKITVNTIEPGLIDTAMTRNDKRWSQTVGETMTTPPPEHPSEQETANARLPKTPLGVPWLTPEQVAPVAVFLASDAAAMVTGATYDVNGGDSAHTT
ncbi:MAG: SDR family NAD(P)-dependent oxidoreductase [Janthinobacterium lividum]